MSNSPLVTCTRISPNKTSPRNHVIDTITIHCIVGQLTAEEMVNLLEFTTHHPKEGASCNYAVGRDGSIGLCVEEKDRSWCSSSRTNDHRAITIECACDKTEPYAITDAAYDALVELCADICKRNNIPELKWKADKSLIGQPDKQNMTVHRWFSNTACPGSHIYNRLGQIAADVNAKLNPEIQNDVGTQASELKDMSEADVVAKVGPLFTADQKKTGVLASVSLAQFILESGYGKTELAQNANNCFGMKTNLSGNTWANSVWNGAKYAKKTKEYEDGKWMTITADFRKYPCIEDSIADHSAYLLGAMNGSKKRYDGLAGMTDHKEAIQLIKDGGYATDPKYVDKLCSIVEKWNLTQYDVKTTASSKENSEYPAVPFTVEVIVDDLNYRSKPSMKGDVKGQTGEGIFTIVEVSGNWGKLKSGVGWIYLANKDYCLVMGSAVKDECPFRVRVDIDNLNIRCGAGTHYARTGDHTGKGIFTIVEVKDGEGSKSGWGRLKSGAGWISLDYTTRV